MRYFRFGPFQLDPQAPLLFRDGKVVPLTPKALGTLALLLKNSGRLVTKDELLHEVWQGVVVEEGSLSQNVSQLRKALGEHEALIETVPKRGYLFTGEVVEVEDGGPPTLRKRDAWPRRVASWPMLAALSGVIIAAAVLFFRPPERTKVAVLRLEDLSGDGSSKYLSDGLTEDLTLLLGNLSPERLGVISRNSVTRYRGDPKKLDQLGRDLGVDYVLEGTVRREGDRVRVTAKLVRAKDQIQVWAGAYERDTASLLRLQTEVAGVVAKQVQVQLDPKGQRLLAGGRSVDPRAFEAYFKGISAPGKAEQLFQESIQAEPGFAPAYWRLAGVYFWQGFFGAKPPTETFPKAKQLAAKAAELDPASAEALGYVAMTGVHYDWKFAEADNTFRQALALNPSQADVRHNYSHYLLAMARPKDSLEAARLAVEFNPVDDRLRACVGWHDLFAGDYEDGVKQGRQAIQMNQESAFGRLVIGWNYEQMGRFEEAIGALREAVSVSGGAVGPTAVLAHAYAISGRRQEAEELLNRLLERSKQKYTSSYDIAAVYTGLADGHHALQWLEQAYQERNGSLVHVRWDPRFRPLHSDSRFRDLLRRIGLPL